MAGLKTLLNTEVIYNITIMQVLIIVTVIALAGIIWRLLKGSLRIILVVGVLVFGSIQFGICTPDDFKNIAEKIQEVGLDSFATFAENSDNIKIENEQLYICVKDEWINLSNIKSIVKDATEQLSITLEDGTTYSIDDLNIIEMFESLQ